MTTLKQRVLDAVIGGADTIDKVLSIVGQHVSASQAALASRREAKCRIRQGRGSRRFQRTPHQHSERGKRIVVTECLGRLAQVGKITRFARGRYGPPAPRLFHPQAG